MKISQTGRHDQIGRTFDITDGPVLPFPYSAAGKTYRVKQVTITYHSRGGGGAWHIDGTYSINLQGPVLKKDGTEGKEIYSGTPESGALDSLQRYTWLRNLINIARPTGKANAFIINELGMEA